MKWVRFYRLGVLLALVCVIHQQARWLQRQRPAPISLRKARQFFESADHVQLRDPERGIYLVTNMRGDSLGALLTTAPFTDNVVGYSGPSDVLIALDQHGRIKGLELLGSADTPEHVRRVRQSTEFLRRFVGWRASEEPPPKIEGVSGATLTSLAIAESIQQRLLGSAPSLRFPEPVSFAEIQTLFTNATRTVPEKTRWRVLASGDELLGFVLRTSPQADNVSGYRGPTECLIAVQADGQTVRQVVIRKSFDTESYVDQVRRAKPFLDRFAGQRIDALAKIDFAREKIEGVSGATLTARAITEGIRRRAAVEVAQRVAPEKWRPQARDWGLAGVLVGAVVMSFTALRGYRWVRIGWQLLLVGYVGLINHDFLSLASLGGWTAGTVAVRTAPALVLLAAASLLVPWGTRRQLYCHQLCPHGAAQQLLGSARSVFWRRNKPASRTRPAGGLEVTRRRVVVGLEYAPALLLAIAVVALLAGWPVSLAQLEAFDAWVWRAAAWGTITLAIVGLVAALFIPQAYCRFGCPTGALLRFIRSSGHADRWGQRDAAALVFLGLSVLVVAGVRLWPHPVVEAEPTTLRGHTIGTSWSVKIRDEVADPASVQKAIDREFEWAESMTSHWRTNTDLSEFNRTLSTNAVPLPWPVITLARWAEEISRATDGAYDVTVGPIVRLWGFGPGPRRTAPPTAAEIEAVLPSVGWQKLEVLDGMLRKRDPKLEVEFSSIAKGWAVDQVAAVLSRRSYSECLVEAGGELRATGRWVVAIEHPTRTCTLTNEALATSGTYRQNLNGDRHYSHLIDPHTGRPITHATVSVSVRAADCGHADAWATALNVLGREKGQPLAEQLNLAAQFVVERADGKLDVFETTGWKRRETLAQAPPRR